ncbi:MFS general substrate transporter [Fomitiporia mediterranea MF3/22]|uniref:MFS general substrate transporter n=1 Tax=Fomitiporia mediterranea (strain MF3/22) TaxID=694068 RepID=UPI00044087EF|nr:MFS general substrate transporter [Fomitiporia mediterranea MF3/22]EJD06511.1 MFS general substrate transporter [Fomitiporia mediterranea MF3/22]
MSAVVSQTTTVLPEHPLEITSPEVIPMKDAVSEPVDPSLQNPPFVDTRGPLEMLQMVDREQPVSRRTQILRQLACYLALYISGYNCGVTGTLLPSIESVYHLTYSSAALLFVGFCIGYFFSAFGSGKAVKRWGFGRVFTGAGIAMMIGIIINCSQLVSFPLMCFAFVIVGTGFSTQLGLANSYFATLTNPMLRMGVLHGVYGFGAFTSPLIASIFISRDIRINLFYLTCLGLIVPSIIISYFSFVHGSARYDRIPNEPIIIAGHSTPPRDVTLKEVASRIEVWIIAIFLLFYIGAEESIGGWIVSYMEVVRHGSAGGAAWVASGFYLGIAIGRVCLPFINLLVGERRVVLMYIILAGGLQAISWAVKSFGATALATAFIGFAISTFYTAAIHTAAKLLPRRMHTSAMTMISSVGQSGSAIFPFIIGVISTKKGIWTVQPAIVALLAGQFICWTLVPKVARRDE